MTEEQRGPEVARLHHREPWEEDEHCPTMRFWSCIAVVLFVLLFWALVSWGLVAWLV